MTSLNPLPKLAYSVAEVCELIGLGRTGVFKEIRERRLRVVKAGRRTLIPAAELKAWLDRLMARSDEGAADE
ncbi:MAG: helix-turn-helix domain-containing protein [Acidobacteria bacterium]|nr:helix-turn-helix domain-containing protein [Acidobacteriota bacterium]